jgi:hypothetical protein
MITLESGGMSYSKKIAYSISKISIPRNERKQTGPNGILSLVTQPCLERLNSYPFHLRFITVSSSTTWLPVWHSLPGCRRSLVAYHSEAQSTEVKSNPGAAFIIQSNHCLTGTADCPSLSRPDSF